MPLALEGTPVHGVTGSVSSTTLDPFSTSSPAQLFIAATINGGAGPNISSITGGGLTWTLRAVASTSASNDIELWTAQASAPVSAVTFTVNFYSAYGYVALDLFAFSGQDTTTIFDTNAAVPASKVGGPDPVLISTTAANTVIIAAFRMGGTGAPTAGSGFTKISGADYQLVEYKIVSSAQTNLSCGIGTGTGDSNACLADALLAAAGSSAKPWLYAASLLNKLRRVA